MPYSPLKIPQTMVKSDYNLKPGEAHPLFKTSSITTKIICILILIILPLNIISIFSARKSQEVIVGQTASSIDTLIKSSITGLDTQITESSTYLYHLITNDPYGITMVRQQEGSDYQNAKYYIAGKLQEDLYLQNSADVYFIYSPALKDMLVSKNSQFTFARSELGQLLSDTSLLDTYKQWKLYFFDGKQWLMRASAINGLYIGSMICIDTILDQLQDSLTYKSVQVTASDTEQVSPPSSRKVHVVSGSDEAGFYIHVLVNRSEIISSLPLFERVGFLITLLYLMLIPVLFMILNRILLRPLRKISSAMTRLKSGDQEYRIGKHKYSREFLNINETFNTMADNIHQLKIEKYEAELKRQKMELRNLQLQIRPHFLLNTFNLMYSLSQLDDRENLENTILYMSDYFRYIFRSNEELENFSLELNLIQSYMQVAKLRYPDGFEITYQISPEALQVRVPPLLIHNFVENTIRHALHDGIVLHISLSASVSQGRAEFVIADDGPGIETELVEKINSDSLETLDDSTHVGLVNSYQRIKYLLGEDATLRVISAPGCGCQIFIRFPVHDLQTNT